LPTLTKQCRGIQIVQKKYDGFCESKESKDDEGETLWERRLRMESE